VRRDRAVLVSPPSTAAPALGSRLTTTAAAGLAHLGQWAPATMGRMIETLFTPAVPLLESVLRGTVTFLGLYVLMRIVGQRESGGLGLTDVLLVVLVAEAAAVGLHGEDGSVTDGLLTVVTILVWSVLLDAAAYRFPRLAGILKARPRPLISDGVLNLRVMRREFMTTDEVQSQLRLHGITDIATVRIAYIEPNGMISVIRTDDRDIEPVEPPPST
jgi:uncharacterized membrane protein YcaP (DUF421 family)